MPTYISKTHPGMTRPVNEDCCGICPIGTRAHLFVVCDGIGGAAGGKQASALTCSAFTDFLRAQLEPLSDQDWATLSLAHIKRIMRAAATDASQRVRAAAQQNPALLGMGSTLVALLLTDQRAFVLHVGDSRLYTVNSCGIEKITRDHSYIQYLLDVGRITPDQVKDLHIQNYITQAIGAFDHVDGDFRALDLETYLSPTYLLLCSDGLYTMVSEDMIRHILLTDDELWDKAEQLIHAANTAGGTDNITAVIVKV